MTLDRTIELLTIEKECVKRAKSCDRNCAECELVQDDKELLRMYTRVIYILKALGGMFDVM